MTWRCGLTSDRGQVRFEFGIERAIAARKSSRASDSFSEIAARSSVRSDSTSAMAPSRSSRNRGDLGSDLGSLIAVGSGEFVAQVGQILIGFHLDVGDLGCGFLIGAYPLIGKVGQGLGALVSFFLDGGGMFGRQPGSFRLAVGFVVGFVVGLAVGSVVGVVVLGVRFVVGLAVGSVVLAVGLVVLGFVVVGLVVLTAIGFVVAISAGCAVRPSAGVISAVGIVVPRAIGRIPVVDALLS